MIQTGETEDGDERRFGAWRSALRGRFAAPQGESMGVACELPTFFRSLSVNCPGPATPLPPSRVLGRFVSGVDEAKKSANERIHFASIAGRKSLKSL
jgi:hypothetical protein